jgi:hypothetical protein
MTYQERTTLDSDLANFVDAIKSERIEMHETWERFAPGQQHANPLVWVSAMAALVFTAFIALDVVYPGAYGALGHLIGR